MLDDALAQNPFSADEYICRKHTRSLLCLPLVKQAKHIPAQVTASRFPQTAGGINGSHLRLPNELLQQTTARALVRFGGRGW
jgi:hypothetical protein